MNILQRLGNKVFGSGDDAGYKSLLDNMNKNQAQQEEGYQKLSEGMGKKKGGKVSSASSRADGCAQRGKTRGKYI
jgi:hypothetical protein